MHSSPQQEKSIARSAGTIMIAFVLSSVMGLVRQIVVANAFGTDVEMEAFNAANRVAETLFNLVAGGALSSAFIPTFASLLSKGTRERAWELASSVANFVLIILIVASALAAIFAPQIVRYVLAPGFKNDPYKEQLTIGLLRVMLPSAVIFGLSGLAMAILNSFHVFFIPAITPSLYQIGMIAGVIVLAPFMGIWGLAYGVLLGACLHLFIQLPGLFKLGWKYSAKIRLRDAYVREVGRLMGPRLLGVAVVQLNFWINTRLASSMPEGSVTAIVLAFTLMLMPEAAIAQSVAIAALPTFSEQVARNRLDQMRISLTGSIRGVIFFALPASIGLIILRKPIIQFLYQRGEFTAWSTSLVAWALLWYAVGMLGHAVVEVLARAFYALHDTRTPVIIGSLAMGLNVIFSFVFSAWFLKLGWLPHGGLALANTIATAIEALCLFALISRRLGGLDTKRLSLGFLQAGLSSVLMGLFLLFWLDNAYQWNLIAIVGGGILGGGMIFVAMGYLVKSEEILALKDFAVKQLKALS